MAAASSSGVEVVVKVADLGERGGEEGHDVKSLLAGERPGLENGETPQEGTKEHMNVVEVRP